VLIIAAPLFLSLSLRGFRRGGVKGAMCLLLFFVTLLCLPKQGNRLQLSHTEMTIDRHAGGADEDEESQ